MTFTLFTIYFFVSEKKQDEPSHIPDSLTFFPCNPRAHVLTGETITIIPEHLHGNRDV